MARLHYDPLKYLVERANKMDDEDKEKVSLSLELLPYAYGKLRSIEHKVAEGSNINITIGSTSPNVGEDSADGD